MKLSTAVISSFSLLLAGTALAAPQWQANEDTPDVGAPLDGPTDSDSPDFDMEDYMSGSFDIDPTEISDAPKPGTSEVRNVLVARQATCPMAYCSGEASWYSFSRGAIFYCDAAMGRNRETRKDKIVALPGFPALLNRSLCGATIRLSWNGRSTNAVIGDRCPDVSCNTRNRRIDLSWAAFVSLGGNPDQGILRGVSWQIMPRS